MLWAEDIPIVKVKDKNGKQTEVTAIAGKVAEMSAPNPAPIPGQTNLKMR